MYSMIARVSRLQTYRQISDSLRYPHGPETAVRLADTHRHRLHSRQAQNSTEQRTDSITVLFDTAHLRTLVRTSLLDTGGQFNP